MRFALINFKIEPGQALRRHAFHQGLWAKDHPPPTPPPPWSVGNAVYRSFGADESWGCGSLYNEGAHAARIGGGPERGRGIVTRGEVGGLGRGFYEGLPVRPFPAGHQLIDKIRALVISYRGDLTVRFCTRIRERETILDEDRVWFQNVVFSQGHHPQH